MSPATQLMHPARLEYLHEQDSTVWVAWDWDDDAETRTSEGFGTVVRIDPEHDTIDVHVSGHGVVCDIAVEDAKIALNSLVARAYAATPYTVVALGRLGRAGRPIQVDGTEALHVLLDSAPNNQVWLERARALSVLQRMRAFDPTVTDLDAQAALQCAEGGLR